MQKYGNRTQSLVNNPEGCLNDKATMHEVSIMVNSKESTKEVNHVIEQRHIPYMSSDTMHSEDFGRNLTPEWIGSLPLIEINVPKPSNRSFIRVQQQQQQQQQQQASQNQTNQPKRSERSKLPMHDQDFFWKRKRDLHWQNYLTIVRATMRQ